MFTMRYQITEDEYEVYVVSRYHVRLSSYEQNAKTIKVKEVTGWLNCNDRNLDYNVHEGQCIYVMNEEGQTVDMIKFS